MKRIGLIACAMVLGVIVSAPAKADVSIILWNGKWCQLWDNAPGNKPCPEDYTVLATSPTWDAALAALNAMIADKKCGW